ncbi:MAG: [FeFe] hydrogenase H-cluster radical SAM maturase HydE [Kiritimatiellia bacterium]
MLAQADITRAEMARILRAPDAHALFEAAYRRKCALQGKVVALRGLVECSNVCAKDCLYCGIRRGNGKVKRYRMSADEIVEAAAWAAENGYGSVVLQSGEIQSEENTAFYEQVVSRLHARFGDDLGITLSLGEQPPETYRRWRLAGAHRYLLRIETSNAQLYARIHPRGHCWSARLECLRALRGEGFIVGTGVMIGLPGQTEDDLAGDIEFFRRENVDMIGMGPYLPHPDTPLAAADGARLPAMELTLRMIALTRLALPETNIAATTALQALAPDGRERGILAGANVIMPNVTPRRYRREYLLYPGKPCVQDSSEFCRGCIERRIEAIGETIAWGRRMDPLRCR